jgi:SAM-dependent methyltransferase
MKNMKLMNEAVVRSTPKTKSHPAKMLVRFCRFCAHPLSEPFLDLGEMPLANSYLSPKDLDQEEKKYPLQVFFCPDCFLVQVPNVVDAKEIFSEYAYFSSTSQSWLDAADRYVQKACKRFHLNRKSHVVEIASNDGYLLRYFKSRGIPVLGVEPARNIARVAIRSGIPTVDRFFGEQTAWDLASHGQMADLIVANNVLAHVPDLNDFVKGFKIILKPKGTITFEFPHLLQLLEGTQFDTIYHEHFSYFSLMTVEKVFRAAGLQVYDVEELSTHGGSLRIYVAHQKAKHSSARMNRLILREKKAGLDRPKIYRNFSRRVENVKRKLLAFLRQVKKDQKKVIGYGAPAKGNTLLNYCGITRDLLPATVDVSSHKQGFYLPGSRIPIHVPGFIGKERPDFLLILPWNLRKEIMGQMSDIRSWGGRFVVPIPEIKIYR